MYGAAQEVEHTASRWSAPRKWLTAVRWLIGAGLHPKANQTTLRVAEDLAARMDYTTGHARYCLLETAARLDVDKATVKRHVKYLRELGALAWVQHGSHANVRPLHDLPGYAATATVYAAVIPASYDHAMGHTIVGTGYTARIVIAQRGQTNDPVDTPGNSPVDNSGSEGLAPPSRTGVKEVGQVDLVGGFNYTEQARPPKARIPNQSTLIGGRRRTAVDVQKASNTTRLVRALVNWTQTVGLRELEFVLRPWTDLGWDALRIADNLNGMCAGVRWKPTNPIAFIRARIAADTRQQAELAAAVAWEDSTAGREAADRASLAKLFGTAAPEPEPERTAEDREYARLYGWEQWEEVAAHYDEDPDDALDLYGTRLCSYAVGKAARNTTYDPA
ncbi:cell wall protein [Streptomyces griseorubiginosus]|uniref:cell wall protein n=1 Tax=Streptomyces griseorubiginosus TaxID=67304 RepID=UPI0033FE926E